MSQVTLAEGSIFGGRYKVVRSIAAGGMGAVYEVLHVETARRRALKVMLPHLVESEDLRRRFQAEARIAGQVESDYIVDVFDAGIDETTQMPFLVMELLRGQDLANRLKEVKRFRFEDTVQYLWQAALALDKTHQANIVHRDLKPENLFLCKKDDGSPLIKVLDFGIAKLVAESGTQANATRSIGTPLYMASEQFRPEATVSPATDIFSLGMMTYTLLVGVPYWADEQAAANNVFALVAVFAAGPRERPTVRALRRGVRLPVAFDEWFAQATSNQPEQRFFKATVAIRALADALGIAALGGPWAEAMGSSGAQGSNELAGQVSPGSRQTRPSQVGQDLNDATAGFAEAASEATTSGSSFEVPSTGLGLTRKTDSVTDDLIKKNSARKKIGVIVTASFAICALGIGLAVAFKNNAAAVENPATRSFASAISPPVAREPPVDAKIDDSRGAAPSAHVNGDDAAINDTAEPQEHSDPDAGAILPSSSASPPSSPPKTPSPRANGQPPIVRERKPDAVDVNTPF